MGDLVDDGYARPSPDEGDARITRSDGGLL